MSYQSHIIDALDRIRNHNLYVHNDILPGLSFKMNKYNKRSVYLVESLATINALVKNGTMLLYGGHGGGKTTLVKYLGRVFQGKSESEIEKAILRGHPQLTEEKILGTLDFKQILQPELIPDDGDIKVKWNEFVNSSWKIIDEINRISHHSQNILLSLLAEGVVKYHNQSKKIDTYTVFATMNPSDAGNVELPMPFLDRFAVAVPITMPDYLSLRTIGKSDRFEKPEPIIKIDAEIISRIRNEVERITFSSKAEDFIDNLISEYRLCDRISKEATNKHTVENGLCTLDSECHYLTNELVCSRIVHPLSVRVKEDLYRYSKAITWFVGDDQVKTDHVKAIAPYLIWHRSRLSEKFLKNTMETNISQGVHTVSPEVSGTYAVIDKIHDRFKGRYKNFLIDYTKATQAKLSSEELDELISRCSETTGDLIVNHELYKGLVNIRDSYDALHEIYMKIDQTDDVRELQRLSEIIGREYSINIRQILSNTIGKKILKLQHKSFESKKLDSPTSLILGNDSLVQINRRIRDRFGSSPYLANPVKTTISYPDDLYNLSILPLDEDTLRIFYHGPEDSDIWREIEHLVSETD